jgi:hypothetical protein
MKQKRAAEPPSCLRLPMFMVGQDSHGHWVVQDLDGIRGGLFISRDAALRFVRSENGNRSQVYVAVSGAFELDMTRATSAPMSAPMSAQMSAPQWQPVPDAKAGRKVA